MNAILKVNSRGTVTIPKALRNALGVTEGGTLMCSLKEEGVMLQPAETYPIRIYTDEEIAELDADDAALAGLVDEMLEKKGLVYDASTRTIREKSVPYMTRKKKA